MAASLPSKTIVIPPAVFIKERERYYLIAETELGMCIVLDRTLPINKEQVEMLEKTKENTTYTKKEVE